MANSNSIVIPSRVKDLTGQAFGKWTVIRFQPRDTKGHTLWFCRCECGTERVVDGASLRNGGSKGCKKCCNRTHGAKDTPEYVSWYQMLGRCRNPRCKEYPRYGGRGITVCKQWLHFETFLEDMGPRPPLCTIERVDNSLGYFKENCKWATRTEQQRNTRSNHLLTHEGKTMCLAAWAEEVGINTRTILTRFRYGWTVEEALTTPPGTPRKRRA